MGKTNLLLFGYLGYVFPFLLMCLIYFFYKEKFDFDFSVKILGGVFAFFAFLLIQYEIFHEGVIAKLFAEFLKKYIGVLGVWIFILLLLTWSCFLIFEEKLFNLFGKTKNYNEIDNTENSNKKNDEIKTENGLLDGEINENKENIIETDKNKESYNHRDFNEENYNNENENSEKNGNKKNENLKIFTKKDKNIDNSNEHNIEKVEVLEDTKKLLSQIETGKRDLPKNWKFPPIEFLTKPKNEKKIVNEAEIDKKIKILLEKLKQFKIEGDVVRYYVGPVVTTFEFKPLPHIKVSKILSLQDDLAMALKAQSIRIQAPIPGKDVVGIEIPNEKMQTIYLREILESDIFKKAKSPLTIAIGKDIVGAPFVTDLKKLPHLLIAGTTGSGKSVGINAMILSLLYRNSPDQLKFVMIDPKMLEFSIYNDIPHLLTPVITEPKKAIVALNAMVKEMERRYKLMAKMRVKNIEGYNQKVDEKLPYIVIIIDELADLMMTSGKDVEYSIARLAQMARASGIHLIVATQRPSVDVVTGLIKANLPSRISFKVGQKIDSKVILDQFGAESLLGRGDMLFTPPGITGLIRLHAPYTSEEEIEKVVEFLKKERSPSYDLIFLNTLDEETQNLEKIDEDLDELFEEAKKIILTEKRTSISYLQRRLNIGYNRAANIIEQMERMGILSKPNSKGQREILM
ncbi:DNA segregation ATPase FtsK/SpoIIIE, S-DNA-T family [Lebetimonas natsushimae]|uniref:DNA segregation ATPase FtsK/SpoIIIE, S-DNA-T family n=1 Tax=Lebetimonas natsushimae TaxID=1936991 RepID=A0A292YAE2_9BACT|nr:DNA segregation ATPase FtsK/SpoIIIE, S-DNA-T family [Lebetimonas natsushimae]